MKNKEVLERLKKCFTNYRFPGGYQELAFTNEKELNSLINDLLKDVEREEALQGMRKNYLKYYKTSTYGKYALCPCCCRSTLSNMDIEERIKIAEPIKVTDLQNGRNADQVSTYEYCDNDIKFIQKVYNKNLKPKPLVFFDEPYTILKWGDFTTIVECDSEDKFDRATGLGIALYRYYRQHKDYKKAYQKLNYALKFEELTLCAVLQFCSYGLDRVEVLYKKLKKFNEGSWNELDI